mmetsp:Transcript_22015/g.45852  ORF Transcript_22015/g.45852 Transcript_22015/m.45852 type:complete len:80 (+) Transcript_22015:792-1031(+)
MKILMTACDEFRKRNINVLKDLRDMGTTSKGLLSFKSLLNHFFVWAPTSFDAFLCRKGACSEAMARSSTMKRGDRFGSV